MKWNNINCLSGSEPVKTDEPVDFMFAQTELMMNEIKGGESEGRTKALD